MNESWATLKITWGALKIKMLRQALPSEIHNLHSICLTRIFKSFLEDFNEVRFENHPLSPTPSSYT